MNSLGALPLSRKLDMPPFWTAGTMLAAWALAQVDPFRPAYGGLGPVAGLLLLVVGAGLMVWSILHMSRAKTTVIPHLDPTHLVTDGPFAHSRNPIYLADVTMLGGIILLLGSLFALPLVALLVVILNKRFIAPEEARLNKHFPDAFAAWRARVRRWL